MWGGCIENKCEWVVADYLCLWIGGFGLIRRAVGDAGNEQWHIVRTEYAEASTGAAGDSSSWNVPESEYAGQCFSSVLHPD